MAAPLTPLSCRLLPAPAPAFNDVAHACQTALGVRTLIAPLTRDRPIRAQSGVRGWTWAACATSESRLRARPLPRASCAWHSAWRRRRLAAAARCGQSQGFRDGFHRRGHQRPGRPRLRLGEPRGVNRSPQPSPSPSNHCQQSSFVPSLR